MSSVMSELGQPGKTAYCATKAAIIGASKLFVFGVVF